MDFFAIPVYLAGNTAKSTLHASPGAMGRAEAIPAVPGFSSPVLAGIVAFHYNTHSGRKAAAGCHSAHEESAPMSNIEERVKKIVIEQLGVKEEDVKNEASFVDDLGADSLDTVELVMALEEEFECDIPDEEAEKISTVQQAIDYVKSHASSE